MSFLTIILIGFLSIGFLSYINMASHSGRLPECGPNEELHMCPIECASDYCPTSATINTTCEKFKSFPFMGCKCKFGYKRDSKGECIPISDCGPVCQGPNEVFRISNIPNCRLLETCAVLLTEISCDGKLSAGCICREGFKRQNALAPCLPECACRKIKGFSECI